MNKTQCTLWGSAFDPNEVASIDWRYWEDGGIEFLVEDYIGTALASCIIDELDDKELEKANVLAKFKEALQAIAEGVTNEKNSNV